MLPEHPSNIYISSIIKLKHPLEKLPLISPQPPQRKGWKEMKDKKEL